MPKVGMEAARRSQLIAATIESIHEDGLANATISRISRRAGLSSGIIAHYFQDKAGLLEATMRSLARELRRQVVAQLVQATTPEARVLAVIDANFAPEQFAPEVVSAWLSFWSQVRQSPELARIQHIYERRLSSNLRHALKRLMPAEDATRVAAGLAALIDGLWLNCAVTTHTVQPEEARAIARDYAISQITKLRQSQPASLGVPNNV